MARKPTPIEHVAVLVTDPNFDPQQLRQSLGKYIEATRADGHKVQLHVPVNEELFEAWEDAFEGDNDHVITSLIFTAQDGHYPTEFIFESKKLVDGFAEYEFPFGRGKGLRPITEVPTFGVRQRSRSKTTLETALDELADNDYGSVLLFGPDLDKVVEEATDLELGVFDGANDLHALNEVGEQLEADPTDDIVNAVADEVTHRLEPFLQNLTEVVADLVHEYQKQRTPTAPSELRIRRRAS